MTEPKPKRRWFRFSLRTFLVIVTLICVWLGWKINEARKQKQAVEAIQANGGTVLYDFEVDENGEPIQPNPTPGWLVRWIGVDYLHNVVSVGFPFEMIPGLDPKRYEYDEVMQYFENLPHVFDLSLSNGNLRDGDLRYIASLTSLKNLWINGNPITGTGFKHLLNLKRLAWIDLVDCPINDDGMEVIANFPHFEKLALLKTMITDDGVDQLRKVASIKILNLDGIDRTNNSRITDHSVETLCKIAGLNAVDLRYTLVTADGIQRLSELKPSLDISCLSSQAPPHPGKNVHPQ
jgi:hypothetical protein